MIPIKMLQKIYWQQLYSGAFLIQHTKDPVKCVGLYNMSEYSGIISVNTNTLDHQFLSDVIGCRKTEVSDCTSSIVTISSFVSCILKFAPYSLQYVIIIVKIHIKKYSIYILGMCWVKWKAWWTPSNLIIYFSDCQFLVMQVYGLVHK